ncbi:vWA domain-containing protein [Brevibacillus massiliensis]|uniref:vWA domain-containing protein n=1 Tax=Brevibacillus massiliensis TaxID=1118054 RepID=UPI0002DC5F8E|nr:VWA domain-containing protein [Brevibacillus massiliensis]
MQWLTPHYLGFALIIPAILLLYLLKRKYENREVASILLWQQMLTELEVSRPFQKLRQNLLLFLQLLAALLIVLALLQPAWPTDGAIARHTVLVLDSSGSMLTREGEVPRFESAKQEAKKIIEKLGPDQSITLIEAGKVPKVLLSDSVDQTALQGALDMVTVRPGTSDSRAALSLAKAIASAEPDSGIIWFGDGGGEEIPAAESDASNLSSFRFVQAGTAAENVAVGTFATQKTAEGVDGLLRIDNYGAKGKKGKVAIYDVKQRLLDAAPFELAPHGSHTAVFHSLPASAAYRAVIDVEQDGLAEDNELWSVPYLAEKGRAALVSPAGNRFLHEVLKIGGRFDVEQLNTVEAAAANPADIWVFDGVVPDKLPEGNVLLINPDRAVNWLPYKGKIQVASGWDVPDQACPLLQHVDWSQVHVDSIARLGEMAGMRGLIRTGEDDAVLAGTIDGRRVVIVAFDLHQSDLVLRPAFPIFMQNVLTWLSPLQSMPIGSGYPGEPLEIPLTPGAVKRVLTLPDGTSEVLSVQGTSFVYAVPEQLGLYRLEEQQGEGKLTRYFSVQMREAESQIAPRRMHVAAGQGQAEQSGQAPQAAGSYQDLTFWLVLLALIIVFAEWRVYQREY